MLAIHLSRSSEETEVSVDEEEVTIGRDPDNGVVLRDPGVSGRHCRLYERDGAWWVIDLGSERGTFVNGRRIAVATQLRETDKMQLGGYLVQIEVVPDTIDEPSTQLSDFRRPRDTEATMLADIMAGDDTGRAVYADWLDRSGRPAEAEFLRLQPTAKQARTPDAAYERTVGRLRELAASIDVSWRMKVARPPIEGCKGFDLACPADWGALVPTPDHSVRRCGTCDRFAHYCTRTDEADAHRARGALVAIDIAAVRTASSPSIVPMAAAGRCATCGTQNLPGSRYCNSCGTRLEHPPLSDDDEPPTTLAAPRSAVSGDGPTALATTHRPSEPPTTIAAGRGSSPATDGAPTTFAAARGSAPKHPPIADEPPTTLAPPRARPPTGPASLTEQASSHRASAHTIPRSSVATRRPPTPAPPVRPTPAPPVRPPTSPPPVRPDEPASRSQRPGAPPPPKPPAKKEPKICATCESPVPESFVFCATCGARMR